MRLKSFFSDVASEMRKVSWPKRNELFRSTLTVITTVVIFGIFFTVVDLGISSLIRLVLE